ncbi:acyltransferase [Pelagibacteraceae bacterium]|nr:acyltransferase [Pelagibacteraceae bacterium]
MIKNRRFDIDTLRGISVISVIIFHIDSLIFPNGYLGVDLFFVISGYVITKSILKSLKNKTFSFFRFYLKRARRILPALLFVLLISLIVAIIILLTADLKRFSESLISSLGFVSNFYFWLTGGYFSTNDQLKPLLHLWSLSVEEQFYLFFPIFLYFLYKLFSNQKNHLIGIILISAISFSLNLYFVSNSDLVFFLFPARVWQFGIGAALALSPKYKINNIWLDSLYLISAFFLIIFNFSYIIKYLPDATLMCIGVGLILFKTVNEKNFLHKFFKIKFLIFIGLISYSLYLWHWPIISFLKYVHVDGIPISLVILSLVLILFLSIISWKFIEQPFLYKYSDSTSIKFILLCYGLLIAISTFVIISKNLPSRYDKFPNLIAQSIKTSYDCPPIKYRKFENTYGCYIVVKNNKTPKNILFGNSHAFMYGWPFIEYLKNIGQNGLIIQLSCLPYIDKNTSLDCLKKARTRFNSIIKSKESQNIFIGLTWYSENLINEEGNFIFDNNFEIRKNSINFLINELEKNKKNVFLIGPIPQPNYDFPSEYSRGLIFNANKYAMKKSRKSFDKKYSEIINYYEKKLGKNFIQPHKKLCDNKSCFFADKKGAFFSDSNHLSKYGAMKILPLF